MSLPSLEVFNYDTFLFVSAVLTLAPSPKISYTSFYINHIFFTLKNGWTGNRSGALFQNFSFPSVG